MESFVVKIWVPADQDGEPSILRGEAIHAGTGRTVRFVGADELVAFLTAAVRVARASRNSRTARWAVTAASHASDRPPDPTPVP